MAPHYVQAADIETKILEVHDHFYEAGQEITVVATVSREKKGTLEHFWLKKSGQLLRIKAE